MLNPRDMTPEQLVTFITNLATAIASGKVIGWLAAQNTAISDELTDINAVLAAAVLASFEADAAADEARGVLDAAYDMAQKKVADAKFGVRSVDSPDTVYEALGFDPPDTVRSIITPQIPTDLVAVPYTVGTNSLKWVGHNPVGRITYVIDARIGDTLDWAIVGTATAQKFRHQGVVSGQSYNYRVRAQGSRNQTSEYSNIAVCYGM
jgi:hypothetical protein